MSGLDSNKTKPISVKIMSNINEIMSIIIQIVSNIIFTEIKGLISESDMPLRFLQICTIKSSIC